MRHVLYAVLLLSACQSPVAPSRPGHYIGRFQRADGLPLVFDLEVGGPGADSGWTLRNAEEAIRVTDIRRRGDSVFLDMPVFESAFRLRDDGRGYSGDWVKAG